MEKNTPKATPAAVNNPGGRHSPHDHHEDLPGPIRERRWIALRDFLNIQLDRLQVVLLSVMQKVAQLVDGRG